MRELGILGGTFDPFHNGHLAILKEIEKLREISKIIMIPTKIPPHKDKAHASVFARLDMLELVQNHNPRFEIDKFEINNKTISYTINTVKYLQENYPEQSINWVIGSDNYFILHTWKKYLKLVQEINFIVINREKIRMRKYLDYKENYFPEIAIRKFKFIEIEPINIASKDIRRSVKNGISIKEFVPSYIEEYILEKGLYI